MTPERLEYLLNEVVLRGECADISRDELYEALRALAENARLREKLIAAERENTLLREAHALHWLRLAMCRGILSDPNRDDEEIAEVLRTTATDDAPTDKDIERARQALAATDQPAENARLRMGVRRIDRQGG